MSNRELANALRFNYSELAMERRAVRLEVARSLNFRHASDRAIDAETQRLLVSRAQRTVRNREIQARLNVEFAAAADEFYAADVAAGWAK